MGGREDLHKLVDEVPEDALHRAEQALKYCINPFEQQFKIEQVKERVRERMQKNLEDHARRMGHGFISGIGSGSGMRMVTGEFRSSMTGWDNGPVTYHLRGFSGHVFEMYERLELATERNKLVLTQRIVAPNGSEQVLIADIPVADGASEP